MVYSPEKDRESVGRDVLIELALKSQRTAVNEQEDEVSARVGQALQGPTTLPSHEESECPKQTLAGLGYSDTGRDPGNAFDKL